MMLLPPTEQSNPLSSELDRLSTAEMVRLMNRLDATIPAVIAEVLPQIIQVVDQIHLGGIYDVTFATGQ